MWIAIGSIFLGALLMACGITPAAMLMMAGIFFLFVYTPEQKKSQPLQMAEPYRQSVSVVHVECREMVMRHQERTIGLRQTRMRYEVHD